MRLSPTSQVAPKAAGQPEDGARARPTKTTIRRPPGRRTQTQRRADRLTRHRSSAAGQRQLRSRNQVRTITRAYCRREEDVVPLLRLARRPRVPHGGALREPPPARRRADDELGRLVLVLLQGDVLQHLDLEGPEPVRRVGEVLAGEGVDHRGEEDDPGPPDLVAWSGRRRGGGWR